MKLTLLQIACLLTAALLTACSSSRTAITPPADMSRELKAAGQNVGLLSRSDADKWLRNLARSYTPWQTMSLSGSLDVKELPLDPSVKIYMERGSLLLISLRVPLLGEVGRVEIDPQQTLVVNRRGKCYVSMSTPSLLSRLGVSITDVQDLLLGRVFLAGSSPLMQDNTSLFTLSQGPGDCYIVTPLTPRDDASYGFTLYPDGKMLLAVAFPADESCLLQNEYSYSDSRTSIALTVNVGSKTYSGTLSYDKPDLSPKATERIKLDPKWKQVSFKTLLSSF